MDREPVEDLGDGVGEQRAQKRAGIRAHDERDGPHLPVAVPVERKRAHAQPGAPDGAQQAAVDSVGVPARDLEGDEPPPLLLGVRAAERVCNKQRKEAHERDVAREIEGQRVEVAVKRCSEKHHDAVERQREQHGQRKQTRDVEKLSAGGAAGLDALLALEALGKQYRVDEAEHRQRVVALLQRQQRVLVQRVVLHDGVETERQMPGQSGQGRLERAHERARSGVCRCRLVQRLDLGLRSVERHTFGHFNENKVAMRD